MSDEHPIIFGGPMIRAILDGRKTQTRRLAKPRSPYKRWSIGDLLWVRETFWIVEVEGGGVGNPFLAYDVDGMDRERNEWSADRAVYWIDNGPIRWGKRPSIFMPRWASRITLEIVDIHQEHLQDIAEEDAQEEGVTPFRNDPEGDCWTDGKHSTAFQWAWNEMHGWCPNSWESNPLVWAIHFERLTP